ncbi:hypothetical protein [Kiloniella sp. b19]|uniref:hypothetical protein n=1 Tax=Kiloniella sp. GXU_MW_B19 TaxID=3141326 RepID=UPI0031DF53FB
MGGVNEGALIVSAKQRTRLKKILALVDSSVEGESLAALTKLRSLLATEGVTLSDLLLESENRCQQRLAGLEGDLDSLRLQHARQEMVISALNETVEQRQREYEALLEGSLALQRESEGLKKALELQASVSRDRQSSIQQYQADLQGRNWALERKEQELRSWKRIAQQANRQVWQLQQELEKLKARLSELLTQRKPGNRNHLDALQAYESFERPVEAEGKRVKPVCFVGEQAVNLPFAPLRDPETGALVSEGQLGHPALKAGKKEEGRQGEFWNADLFGFEDEALSVDRSKGGRRDN